MFTPNILIAWSRLVNTDIFLLHSTSALLCSVWVRFDFVLCGSCYFYFVVVLLFFFSFIFNVFLINAFQPLRCVLFFLLIFFLSRFIRSYCTFEIAFNPFCSNTKFEMATAAAAAAMVIRHRSKHSMFNKSNKKLFNYKNDNGKRKERKQLAVACFFLYIYIYSFVLPHRST